MGRLWCQWQKCRSRVWGRAHEGWGRKERNALDSTLPVTCSARSFRLFLDPSLGPSANTGSTFIVFPESDHCPSCWSRPPSSLAGSYWCFLSSLASVYDLFIVPSKPQALSFRWAFHCLFYSLECLSLGFPHGWSCSGVSSEVTLNKWSSLNKAFPSPPSTIYFIYLFLPFEGRTPGSWRFSG